MKYNSCDLHQVFDLRKCFVTPDYIHDQDRKVRKLKFPHIPRGKESKYYLMHPSLDNFKLHDANVVGANPSDPQKKVNIIFFPKINQVVNKISLQIIPKEENVLHTREQ